MWDQSSRRALCAYTIFIPILMGHLMGVSASAQTGPYQSTAIGTIGGTTACGTNNYVTTITVADDIMIADLDVGFLATHAWRSDINATLTSPAGTSVKILDGAYGVDVDNYNVRFDDASGTLVDTAPHNTNDTITSVPPYQNTVRPENLLNAFNGENANGTWTLSMCDVYPAADGGQFRQANLFFTPIPAVLSAAKTVNVWDPDTLGLYALPGNDVIYTISIQNTGNGYTDKDSMFLVDSIPDDMVFYNGDMDDGGPETSAIAFTNSGSGLSFNPALHVKYSNAATKPTDLGQCSYTPIAGYDPAIKHVCIQPAGQMQFDPATPAFSISFRAKIK